MLTIHELHEKLVNGDVSAVELTKAFLAHKDTVEPKVQAFLSDNRDYALEAAHSEIRGSKVICTYPRLIAAYHVLHRLREPRHPPCALTYFLSYRSRMVDIYFQLSTLLFLVTSCQRSLSRIKD